MKKQKRLLAGLLALLLAVTGMPLYGMEVQAEEEGEEERLTEGNFTYKVNEDGTSVTITRYQEDVNCLDVTIPSEISGKSVTSIGNDAFWDCNIRSITIPGSVTSIGDSAFSSCGSLKNVSIPGSVTSIGGEAFYRCDNLKSVSILDGVTSIGNGAFSGCSSLKSVSIPSSVTSIGDSAFSSCSSLKSVAIPSSVTSIGEAAFGRHQQDFIIYGEEGSEAETAALRDSIPFTLIGSDYDVFHSNVILEETSYAYDGTEKTPDVTVEIGGKILAKGTDYTVAYANNTGVSDSEEETTATATITGTGSYTGTQTVEFHIAKTAMEGYCKYQVNDDKSSVTIVEYCYRDGYGDKAIPASIIIPEKIDGKDVTAIGERVFCGIYDDLEGWSNNDLKSITLPNSLTSIGDSAFRGCYNLESITIPNGVTSIRDYTFRDCYKLTSITLPNSLDSIGEFAFYRCRSLKNITIPNSVASIGDYAFYNCRGLESITVEEGNPVYGDDGACNLIMRKADNALILGCKNTTIPESVLSIASGAFYGCGDLTGIVIPNSVTSIGKQAFFDCYNLENITIPNSVTSIGDYAFMSYSSGLKSITIPKSVTSIGKRAFGFSYWEGDFDIELDGGNKKADFIIYGESGSKAEAYAKEYGFPFNGTDAGGDTGTTPGNGSSQNGGSQGGTGTSQADISKAAVTLEKDSYPYDGKPKTPAVTVTLNGKTLTPNTDYTVAYADNINVGTAEATVTGKGNYKGSVTKTFTITAANNSAGNSGSTDGDGPAGDNGSSDGNGSAGTSSAKQPITCKKKAYTVAYGTKPFKLKVTSNGSLTYKSSNSKIAAVGRTNGKVTIKNTGTAYITAKTKTDSVKITINVYPKKPSVKSLSVGKGRKLTVKWAKDRKATGYQVQISTSKNFKKNVKKQNTTKTACTFKKLKAGSKYYVRLRSFKKSGKNTLYSAWSKPKKSNKIKR